MSVLVIPRVNLAATASAPSLVKTHIILGTPRLPSSPLSPESALTSFGYSPLVVQFLTILSPAAPKALPVYPPVSPPTTPPITPPTTFPTPGITDPSAPPAAAPAQAPPAVPNTPPVQNPPLPVYAPSSRL